MLGSDYMDWSDLIVYRLIYAANIIWQCERDTDAFM